MQTDVVATEAADETANSTSLALETHGLAVTSPAAESVKEADPAPELDQPMIDIPDAAAVAPQAADELQEAVEVSGNVSNDPSATVAAALVALGKFYNMGGVISAALVKHLRATAGEPELHAFLNRNQALLGEFRHAFEQIDEGMSDMLRDAIQDAIAA